MTVEYKLKEERKYPYVGVLKDDEHETIVLFTDWNTGIMIYSTLKYSNKDINARCRTDWLEYKFEICEEITIKM